MKNILVTGAAGFIGFHLSRLLLTLGYKVSGIDNLNDYYEVSLKKSRLEILLEHANFSFHLMDLASDVEMSKFAKKSKFDIIVNLAAQAGVQYSITNPHVYIDSNIRGFLNILELSKTHEVEHLIYASSSSVYGLTKQMPFSEDHSTDHPISLYAATKKSNELMAHTYSYLFDLPTTGLRFFTVYGPWGRPDMALFKFTKALIEQEKISINNFGNHARDFTYVEDIVQGIVSVIDHPFEDALTSPKLLTPSQSSAKWRILNIGRGEKVELMDFIHCIEKYFNREIQKEFLPLQPGDVAVTFCNTEKLQRDFEYNPSVSIEEGVKKFLDWYVDYYKVNI
jgi:UDP-glucuronate 4-epimerase